jgi:hypothetical protein
MPPSTPTEKNALLVTGAPRAPFHVASAMVAGPSSGAIQSAKLAGI